MTDSRLSDEQVQAIADLQYPNLNALAAEVQEWRKLAPTPDALRSVLRQSVTQ